MSASASELAILSSERPLRVMVVDDSLIMRSVEARMINGTYGIAEVVALVSNGQFAIARAQKRDLDVVVLDIDMPIMDGLAALAALLEADPNLVVIMTSTLTGRNADLGLKALMLGAKDYVVKPSALTPGAGIEEFRRQLIEKIYVLGRRFRRDGKGLGAGRPLNISLRRPPSSPLRALAFGCSTGGPNALLQVLTALPRPLRVPVFIAQDLPPLFTEQLARNITRDSGHRCVEVRHGDVVQAGTIYVAPGGHVMTVVGDSEQKAICIGRHLRDDPQRHAIDPMLSSLSAVYGRDLMAVILSGMGQDGLAGSEAVVRAGGGIIAQNESSSVVWDMPGAVARAGLCCFVLPLQKLAAEIAALLEHS